MATHCWATMLLLLTAAAAAAALATPPMTVTAGARNATEPPPSPPPHHLPRRAEVIVIDVTKNTSSVVTIPLAGELSDNMTAAVEAQKLKEANSLRCITQQNDNLFLLVHLNRNWRKKLSFVRKLLSYTYKQSSTNVAIVFFNAFTHIVATFGTDPVTSEAELLLALSRVQISMERDESAAVSEHWVYFQLDDALRACFRYAKLFLHQFSLDGRPSLLLSYFDDGAVIGDATIDEAEKVLQQFKAESPFKASVSILQWPSNLPVPPLWARVSELLSSSPSYQVTGSSEDNLLGLVAELAGDICNKTLGV